MSIKRIISLAPSNTEIIFALGESANLVGVTEFCNYPPEIDKIGGFSTKRLNKYIREPKI
jgi:iron complex transport system substrate-binding protein